ncbi:hypothetical protein [Pseudooceanicola marinus]|uniref:phage head spike fiber domain-containing protein n=1 Tax=Pseudooceanicola marinus TaxID=396013 RepID=UPI001CD6A7DE|nr:hypothetical protein [Pseudooceanicola marinus]MCA1337350.1 hypothetical protein [Pseudooceanicola marinus]
MIGIGTGAIALGGGAGNWVARDPVARNAHLYFSPATGRYARDGVPVSFSQMGTFEAAGTRFERKQGSPLLTPVGVDVPRLADYSTGSRRWLMEGTATNRHAFGTLNQTEGWEASFTGPNEWKLEATVLAPDGLNTIGSYEYRDRAFYRTVGNLVEGATYTASCWVKCSPEGVGKPLYLRKPGAAPVLEDPDLIDNYGQITLDGTWQRITATRTIDAGDGTSYNWLLENRLSTSLPGIFDDNYQIAVWGAQLEEGDVATSVIETAGSSATRAPEFFTSDLSGFGIGGANGCWVYANFTLSDEENSADRIFQLGDDNPNSAQVYYDQAAGELIARSVTDYNAQFIASVPYTKGTDVKVAYRMENGNFAFVVNGVEISGTGSGIFPSAGALYVASSASGLSKPRLVEFAELWVAPAPSYTVASMEALTA